jgi:chemotaxis protein methyltransferase CheR
MTDQWFQPLCDLVRQATGVLIDANKDYLAVSRLSPLLARHDIEDLEALVNIAVSGTMPDITRNVIEAMMTGETFFFRDVKIFDHFTSRILPSVLKQKQQDRVLRIWSAACSQGQEPYSLAMILDELSVQLRGWRVDLFASDVSAMALERARQGNYNQFEVQRGLPVSHLLRYFYRETDHWKIAEHIRSRVEFVRGSLLDAPCGPEKFDVIFCRNVLMYFSPDARKQAFQAIDNQLNTNGWLILGTSEGGIIKNPAYQVTQDYPAIFQKKQLRSQGDSQSSWQTTVSQGNQGNAS